MSHQTLFYFYLLNIFKGAPPKRKVGELAGGGDVLRGPEPEDPVHPQQPHMRRKQGLRQWQRRAGMPLV